MSIDAVRGKQDRRNCLRLAHADELATALGLDMALWWEPTKTRYLGRVSKRSFWRLWPKACRVPPPRISAP